MREIKSFENKYSTEFYWVSFCGILALFLKTYQECGESTGFMTHRQPSILSRCQFQPQVGKDMMHHFLSLCWERFFIFPLWQLKLQSA